MDGSVVSSMMNATSLLSENGCVNTADVVVSVHACVVALLYYVSLLFFGGAQYCHDICLCTNVFIADLHATQYSPSALTCRIRGSSQLSIAVPEIYRPNPHNVESWLLLTTFRDNQSGMISSFSMRPWCLRLCRIDSRLDQAIRSRPGPEGRDLGPHKY